MEQESQVSILDRKGLFSVWNMNFNTLFQVVGKFPYIIFPCILLQPVLCCGLLSVGQSTSKKQAFAVPVPPKSLKDGSRVTLKPILSAILGPEARSLKPVTLIVFTTCTDRSRLQATQVPTKSLRDPALDPLSLTPTVSQSTRRY